MVKLNYSVTIFNRRVNKHHEVIVRGITQLTDLVQRNAVKGRLLSIVPTTQEPTHKSASAAQAYIEVLFMGFPLKEHKHENTSYTEQRALV